MSAAKKKITWASFLILDSQLHRTSQLEVLTNLAKRGHQPVLIGVRSRDHFRFQHTSAPRLFLLPIRYFPFVAPTVFSILLALLLPLHIIRFNPDFVIMEPELSVIGSIPSLIVSKFRKTKFILDIRSVPVEIHGFSGVFRKLQFTVSVRIAKRFFSGVTIITPMMKREICEQFGIKPSKVGVWTSGVSTTLFDPANYGSQRIDLRERFRLSNSFVVFYHGHLSVGRGLIETIEAIKLQLKRNPNIVLFLLGAGPMVPLLKAKIKQEDIEKSVIIHSAVAYEEVPKFISMGDVCVIPLQDNPDWRFQSPLKLHEYLSMEKVVIVTDIPAHRSIIGEKECGIYISSAKPIEIAKAIEYAYHNKEKLEQWGNIGRTIVEQEYTWEKVARDLENYLLSIDELRKK